MGKKSKKGISRAGQQRPAAGEGKSRIARTMMNGSSQCSSSVRSCASSSFDGSFDLNHNYNMVDNNNNNNNNNNKKQPLMTTSSATTSTNYNNFSDTSAPLPTSVVAVTSSHIPVKKQPYMPPLETILASPIATNAEMTTLHDFSQPQLLLPNAENTNNNYDSITPSKKSSVVNTTTATTSTSPTKTTTTTPSPTSANENYSSLIQLTASTLSSSPSSSSSSPIISSRDGITISSTNTITTSVVAATALITSPHSTLECDNGNEKMVTENQDNNNNDNINMDNNNTLAKIFGIHSYDRWYHKATTATLSSTMEAVVATMRIRSLFTMQSPSCPRKLYIFLLHPHR
jgi:hypothetical protein